ncbi:hypothetical protein ACQ4PT_066112 [Festuca glaucescens]
MQGHGPAGELLLRLLFAVLLVAFAAPAAAAYGGRVIAGHAATGTRESAHLDTPALTRRIDDGIAPELSWADSLVGSGIRYDTLDKGHQACNPHCGNPGQSYTGHGCTYKDRCGQ